MKPLSLSPAVVILLGFGSPLFGLSLPVSEDTSTTTKHSTSSLTVASGKATTLPVSPTQDALVLFDLGGLPSGFTSANVVGARLRVYVSKVTKPGDLAVHVALDPWSEAASGAAPGIADAPLAAVPA